VPIPADSELSDSLFLEAMRHYNGNNPGRAKKVFERVLSRNPDHVNTLCNLGALERNAGRLDAAIPLLERAVAGDPKLVPARLVLGEAFAAFGRVEEAIGQYRRVLELAPQSDFAHAGLALALRTSGDLDGAMRHFQQAVAINQQQPAQFYQALGQTLMDKGNFQGAEISLQHALALNPNLEPARRALDELQRTRGRESAPAPPATAS
jgi:tetratricopeptide (TPR) repeat protein